MPVNCSKTPEDCDHRSPDLKGGKFAPTFSAQAGETGVISQTAGLLHEARAAGLLVVYTRVCFRPGYPDLVANGHFLAGTRAAGALVDGDWGADIIDELTPAAGDVTVSHRRISGFWGSDLQTILQARGLGTVLLTGVATNLTVLNTAFDAVNVGYHTAAVTDCCSACTQQAHEEAIATIAVIGDTDHHGRGGDELAERLVTGYDAGAFQAFERAGWNDVAAGYPELVDGFGLTVGPVGAAILDAADVRRGRDVLDVATGPGYLADLALERGANVVGIDIAESMVQLARRRHPTATFHVGAAESLPLPDRSFDAVVSAWGLPHFADHAAFFAEAQRVLTPGGAIALGTWCPPPGNEFFALLLGVLTPHLTANPNLPAGPDMFRYADADTAQRDLTQAGFKEISITPIALTPTLDHGAEDLIRFLAAGSVRSRAMYQAQPTEARQQIHAALRSYCKDLPQPNQRSGVQVGLTAVVIAARKS